MKVNYTETISWTKLDKFIFVFEEETATMFRFEGIFKEFWLMIDKKKDLDEILEVLYSKYEVDQNILYEDVTKLIMSLEACGILTKEE